MHTTVEATRCRRWRAKTITQDVEATGSIDSVTGAPGAAGVNTLMGMAITQDVEANNNIDNGKAKTAAEASDNIDDYYNIIIRRGCIACQNSDIICDRMAWNRHAMTCEHYKCGRSCQACRTPQELEEKLFLPAEEREFQRFLALQFFREFEQQATQ